jgi:Protein of unknown function (DUF1254)/Protein of unknown function (DUF1214)
MQMEGSATAGVVERIADAYVWGLPLLLTHRARAAQVAGAGESDGRGGLTARDRLATAADRTVVAPNNDTLYASGWFDLRDGEVVIEAGVMRPPDRYWSVMLLDAYTHVAYVCRRLHGRDGARVRVTYDPTTPPITDRATNVLTIGTPTLWVLVRVLVNGPGDVDAARGCLSRITVTPSGPALRAGDAIAAERPGPATGMRPAGPPPRPSARARGTGSAGGGSSPGPPGRPVQEARDALHQLAAAVAADPPAAWHAAPPDGLADLLADPPAPTVVAHGVARGQDRVRAAGGGADRFGNGWGTRIRGACFGDDVTYRAAFAQVSLAGHLPAENRSYSRGVDGRRPRALRFPAGGEPPVDAFWSLTAYGPDLFLVPNPLDRHSVGDRTPGLRRDPDGGVTVWVSAEPPGEAGVNWLPAPPERGALVLRCYEGAAGVRDATWFPPDLEPA